jgi:hypothetical protein
MSDGSPKKFAKIIDEIERNCSSFRGQWKNLSLPNLPSPTGLKSVSMRLTSERSTRLDLFDLPLLQLALVLGFGLHL